MTAFAAIFAKKHLGRKEEELFANIVSRLKSQIDGLSCDSIKTDNLIASKMWLPHCRTYGFARDKITGSWLACIGNPVSKIHSALTHEHYTEEILHDYFANGPSAFLSLNAPFVAIFYDGRKKSLNVITDRTGLQHIYLTELAESFVLSTSSLALASTIRVHLDRESLVDYFLTGNLTGQKTFFKEIRKIGDATWLSIVNGRIESRRYWSVPCEEIGSVSFKDASYQLADKLLKSVDIRLSPNGRTSVELTGGLDSRVNLACAAISEKPFHAWTIGEPDCTEVRIAKQLRHVQDFQHHVISPAKDIDDRFLDDLRVIHVLTDGETNCLNLIASPSCNRQTAELRDASVSGLGGEILRGFYYISHKFMPNRSGKVHTQLLINLKMLPNIGGKPEIFSDVFPKDCYSVLKESVESHFSTTVYKPLFWRLDDFYFRVREQRFAGRSCTFNNFFYRCQLPFFDNDVIDLAFRMPWRFKRNSKIVKNALFTFHPGYADVPLVDGLPARPLRLLEWPSLLPYYSRFARKAFGKIKQICIGRSCKNSDYVGLSARIARKLASEEINTMLNPDNMASAFLYNVDKYRDFIRSNRENGYKERIQIGLILSFELTCRYLGNALEAD